ncbi:peptidase C39 [Phenylobacterium hankyongense]|uniref:Peptidase C39 n=1 Tax=Phenylobacterium hankyongense TaxID=1813876 RepID=A0A328AZW1_9CAUL|nr:C39 family peptidase [Phenylobacterium hankyongense]RAK60189.1 peptidase C39 [Phenylobacterium hankyongense]
MPRPISGAGSLAWAGAAALLAFGAAPPGGAAPIAPSAEPRPDTGSRPDAKPVRSLLELRDDRLVRQHWDLSCGAAAIATLMTYQLGDPVSERQAALGMLRTGDVRLVRARLGFSLLDLKRFAASRGFAAAGYADLSLDELLAMAPAVAPIRVRGFGHFVVVRGRRGDRLLLGDPAFGNRTMSVEGFMRVWTSRIGFVVAPPDDPHPPNRMGAPPELFLAPSGPALRAADAALRTVGGPS